MTVVSCSSLDDFDDFDDVEDTQIGQRQWLLCVMCAQAVWREVERAALSTPLRVAVAAALVASVRNPRARPAVWSARYWEDMDCATQDKLAARAVIALILWPIMMLVGVVALAAALR